MGKGGAKTPATQQVTSTTSNLPEYAAPYYTGMLNMGQALTNPGSNPYIPYGGQRIADFNPAQQAVHQGFMNLDTPEQFSLGSTLSGTAGLGSLALADYNPAKFNAQQVGLPSLMQYSMSRPSMISGGQFGAPSMGAAQTGWSPNLQQFQMGGARDVSAQQVNAPSMQGARTGYRPDLNQFQFGQTRDVTGQAVNAPTMQGAQTGWRPDLQQLRMGDTRDVNAQFIDAPSMQAAQTSYGSGPLEQHRMAAPDEFGQVQADKYMSPYMQSVLDVQKREAVTDAKKSQLANDLGAARQGTYGGSRQLLATLERERDLGQQLGDIQAKGLQSAYENAQAQFERDRTANMMAGRENLGAALQQQQLGVSTGLQAALANLDKEQQARVNNQALAFQARGMNQEQAMRAALANQGVDVTRAQANLQSGLQTQELGTRTSLEAALANLSNEQQARVNNQAAELQARGMTAENAMRAALANQGVDVTRAQQNLGAQLQTQELGATQALQTALANLNNEQQAAVQNQAAQLQAQGMNQEQALRAALANQGVDVTRAQQNLAANLQTQELGTRTGLEAALANLNTQQQANVQNLAAQLQTQGLNAEQAMQAALANQQMQFNTGQQNLQAALQTQGLGAETGLRALLANQQANLEAQRLSEMSRQFGSQQGLAALQQANQSGQTLGNLGQFQQNADLQRLAAQQGVADMYQQQEQRYLDTDYADFLRQRDYPMEQLAYFNALLRGLPLDLNTRTTTYAPPPSMASQVLGTGLGALGMYKTLQG